MQLLYTLFFRQYGVRRVQHLLTPRLFTLNNLPRDSFIHYVSHDEEHLDIDISKLYYSKDIKRILVDYPAELTGNKGAPRKLNILLRNLFKPFHVENKRFRYLDKAYQKVNDQLTLFVNNYSYLHKNNRYLDIPLTSYYKWWNINKTIFDNIRNISKDTVKNHFVFIDIPVEIPSLNFLNLFSTKINTGLVKVFDDSGKLFILEMWKWLSVDNRGDSIFAGLEEQDYNKVNLVFTGIDARSCVINLGYLNSWIKGRDNTTEFTTVTQFAPIQMQKLFLKFLISINSVAADEEESTEVKKADPADAEEESDIQNAQQEYHEDHDPSDVIDDNEFEDGISSIGRIPVDKEKILLNNKLIDSEIAKSQKDNEGLDLNKKLFDIDSDLKSLEILQNKQLKDKGILIDENGNVIEEEILEAEIPLEEIDYRLYADPSIEQALDKQIDSFADYGLLSAADFRKLKKEVENLKDKPDPYGSNKTYNERSIVTEKDILLDEEKVKMSVSDHVTDPSMKSSSLLSFDYDYITKVMEKDTLSMVSHLQKTGVIVKRHEMELDSSTLGEYENHTLELKPLDGVSSTIRFRIPKVNSDGTFLIAGNKTTLRKQRIDVPIRKINPHTVQLTSYYGKTFVTLNQKKVNNSLDWIVKKVNEASIEDDNHIVKVGPAKVFDNNFKAPFIYNGLADNFKLIETRDLVLVFDHTEREKIVPDPVLLQKLETNSSRVVGFTKSKEVITISRDNKFFKHASGVVTPLGNIYDVLKLLMVNAPVDFSEVRVFSKTIPVGIILAYFIGFINLVRHLKLEYRIVENRKPKNLSNSEFAITFKDQSFVFDRFKNSYASLIIGGFLDFDKETKRYETKEFNSKNVYLNLLESKGLGSLYIREIQLTQDLFVDPITKGILKQMGEPLSFNGLLTRATELLTTYDHPDSQDMSVMRIRGYERIPGAVYKDLVAAIRQYKNKNIAGKSRIDISPYQVWSTITKDPAVKLIEDINPIQNLKELEIVTYVGEGGRSKDAIAKPSRAYHVNDMGIVSEATVDSSDVGVNAYLSANPEFRDLRGLPKIRKEINAGNLMSTSALLSPGADKDDPKRVN